MPEPTASAAPSRALPWLELALVVAVALGALLFHATLPGRMPSDADYQAAAAAVRAELQSGDAVAVLPEWAEKARMFLPGVPFVSAPVLADADLSRVKRLWIVELPSLPRAEVARSERAGTAQMSADGPPRRFGNVVLKRFVNRAFHEPRFDFTRELGRANVWLDVPGRRIDCARDGERHDCGRGLSVAHEIREVQFAPHDCVGANPVGRDIPLVVDYPDALLANHLTVMAAVTGEMGWRHGEGQTPVDLTVEIDGQRAGALTIPVGTVPPQHLELDTARFDPKVPHDVRFAVATSNPKDREFCFDAASE